METNTAIRVVGFDPPKLTDVPEVGIAITFLVPSTKEQNVLIAMQTVWMDVETARMLVGALQNALPKPG